MQGTIYIVHQNQINFLDILFVKSILILYKKTFHIERKLFNINLFDKSDKLLIPKNL